jgi:two-component system chemotaxis sensor kinase CheA
MIDATGATMDDLLADFLTETNENLAELDVALLALERTPDDAATLSLIFRMVHTIKGTCGFLVYYVAVTPTG